MNTLPGHYRPQEPGCCCVQFAPTEDTPRRHHPDCPLAAHTGPSQ